LDLGHTKRPTNPHARQATALLLLHARHPHW
jgi:hypothetical protein